MTARRKSTARKKARKTSSARRAKKQPAARKPAAKPEPKPVSLSERVTELVERAAAGVIRRVVDTGGRELASLLPDATADGLRAEAGASIRELRELAGLTRQELAEAIELRDESLLEAVEAGTATLSFELILRLASILARHDPIPFASRLVRSYNPVMWQMLEDWGVGRLPQQLERERKFQNVLRGHDEARDLSDEEFERVLAFTREAFEMALRFAREGDAEAPPRSPRS